MKRKFKSLSNKNIIFDTNVLIDFKELGIFCYLPRLFKQMHYSANAYYHEFDNELKLIIEKDFVKLNLVTNDGYTTYQYLANNHKALSLPDKVFICIAKENNLICCTNELPARKVCEDLDLVVTGTIGVICSLYENKIINHIELSKFLCEYFEIAQRLDERLKNRIRALYKI